MKCHAGRRAQPFAKWLSDGAARRDPNKGQHRHARLAYLVIDTTQPEFASHLPNADTLEALEVGGEARGVVERTALQTAKSVGLKREDEFRVLTPLTHKALSATVRTRHHVRGELRYPALHARKERAGVCIDEIAQRVKVNRVQ